MEINAEIEALREALKDREEQLMQLQKKLAYYEILLAAKSTRPEDLMREREREGIC